MTSAKTLIVVTGPTASGKTKLAINLARELGCEIISADSRQIFHDIPIGTAAPTQQERQLVPHHLVDAIPLTAYYSAAQFEADALTLVNSQFERGDYTVVCGGSMMYVDALVNGIDALPSITDEVRKEAYSILDKEGVEGVIGRLRLLDPLYLMRADLHNHKRLVHALEICMQSGVPYSSLCTGHRKRHPFRVVKLAIELPREILFERINARVEQMMLQGMLEEARRVYPLRHLNSLNTVGFKELFMYFDGVWDLTTATARMAKNTRVYAKKQLTWLKRDPSVVWLDGTQSERELLRQAIDVIKNKDDSNKMLDNSVLNV